MAPGRATVQDGPEPAGVAMTQPDPDVPAPDAAMIEELARAAIAALPPAFRDAALRVVLRIEDFPSDEIMDAMEVEDPFDLTGLYEGIPLTEKSVMDQPHGPDVIWLFRRPILDEWCERGDVGIKALVAHVVVHELAHHFGWSDDDIAAIDRWWE
jgi:predicted Zn-dependent protease with MMP-like domain